MNIFKLFGTIAINNAEANKAIDSTGSKALSLAKNVGKGALAVGKAAAKVATTAVVAGATAAAAMTKAAVTNYAEYEQLVGGVETLFGAGGQSLKEYAKSTGKTVGEASAEYKKLMAAQDTVLKNSENAYMTAGMSQNEYMSTVTSFSASLIQSLKGDTELAAKYSDRAITDMSDNANKMGTDMELIQNAYNGFAKQNYTMLDNLKLGYGGTQSEMQRLIKDAAAMTDVQDKLNVKVDASSMSFGNVVNAISVMQESMGIAGTTAREASSTIEGSLKSTKAAWDNLLTGLGKGKGIGKLSKNLTASISNVITNIKPVIRRALNGIGDMVSTLVPQLINDILPTIINFIPKLAKTGITVAKSFGEAIISAIPKIWEMLLNTLDSLIPGMKDTLSPIGGMISEVFGTLQNMAQTLLPVLMSAFQQIAPVTIDVLGKALSVLSQIVEALLPVVIEFINQALPILQQLFAFVSDLFATIMPLIQPIMDLLMSLLEPLMQLISMILPPILSLIKTIADVLVAILTPIIKVIVNILKVVLPPVITVLSTIIGVVANSFTSAFNGIKRIWSGLTGVFKKIWEGIKSIFGGVGEWFVDTFGGAVEGVKRIFDSLINVIKVPINFIIGGLNKFIDSMNELKIPDWVPVVGGNYLNFPHIQELEEGGVLKRGQVGLLEGNGAEAVVPLEKNTGWLDQIALRLNGSVSNDSSKQLDLIIVLLQKILNIDFSEIIVKALEGTDISWNKREIGRVVRSFG